MKETFLKFHPSIHPSLFLCLFFLMIMSPQERILPVSPEGRVTKKGKSLQGFSLVSERSFTLTVLIAVVTLADLVSSHTRGVMQGCDNKGKNGSFSLTS